MADDPQDLRIGSFATHSARGLIRDRATRRGIMFAAVAVAFAMIVCGTTILSRILDPHTHPLWCIVYWLACAWMTVLALLLAIYDLLAIRREGRAVRQNLKRHFSDDIPRQPDER